MTLHDVSVVAAPLLERYAPLLGPAETARLAARAQAMQGLLAGRTVWNVNSTATGGGVAEMLQRLIAYGRGVGVDTRWVVIRGDAPFFAVTKRLHNMLHGAAGDGGSLGSDERAAYAAVQHRNAADLVARTRPGDIAVLHDPQTAGLTAALVGARVKVVWRSHVGIDVANDLVERAWSFLRPYIEPAYALVFSRAAYVPSWAQGRDVRIIAPSIDPFSAKNCDIEDPAGILADAGIVAGGGGATFTRRDGSTASVRSRAIVVRAGGAPPADMRFVVQVSRWDHLKDMAGVMAGFAAHVIDPGVHLLLVGPDTRGVSDDPEGAIVLRECRDVWDALEPRVRARVHIVSLPVDDVEENAAIVNAIQRHATVVVQKSLAEGFGLTVTEAMWKARPVLASAVGGIRDQIVDGEHGLLLHDPRDLTAFGTALVRLLGDPAGAQAMGARARQRVIERFLGTRHLTDYGTLFADLVRGPGR